MNESKLNIVEIEGKACVITGGYKGFGLALADRLASAKARLVVSGRDEAKLNEASNALKRKTEVVAVKADVTKVRDCKKVIDACIESYGKLDILINNAGVLEDGLGTQLVDRLVDTNLKGLEYCSYYAIKQMKKQEHGGLLVNIASTSGVTIKPREEEAIYTGSKFGVVAYSGSLHLAYKSNKIKVICFCPGGMKTDLFRHNPERMLQDFMDPDAVAGILLKQIRGDKWGLSVLLRRGLLQYNKDFALSWQWASEENVDLAAY